MLPHACPNFRDVGQAVRQVLGRSPLPARRVYRGGRIDLVQSAADIGDPATIVNLRPRRDSNAFTARLVHVPSEKDVERYDTRDPQVRRWLARVLRAIAGEATRLPVLIHCVSGKDRTGVVVAALLAVLDVPRHAIVAEYLLSEGDVRADRIHAALDGFGDVRRYFRAVDVERLCRKLVGA